MVRIISDTSTMYSTAEARAAGFAVSPLSVTIAGKSYREYDEISSQQFVDIINQGHMPTSSQPAIGEVTDLYEEFSSDEILNIAMAHGLSGTYTSAVAAQSCATIPTRSPWSTAGPSAVPTATWWSSAPGWPRRARAKRRSFSG